MANERILLVEDDLELTGIIKDYLKNDGFEVYQAFNGKMGIESAKEISPDLIILDIMLPQVDGIEVCRNIRLHSHAPIVVISAKSSDYDKILSLGVGADDYLTKPFSMVEMVARVKSHLRRYTSFSNGSQAEGEKESHEHQFGDLVIDSQSYKVTVRGKEIVFTSREFKLLNYLTMNPSIVFSKQQLMDNVWGFTEYIDENTVAVYVARIREKLVKEDIDYIKTVWGVGYKWEM